LIAGTIILSIIALVYLVSRKGKDEGKPLGNTVQEKESIPPQKDIPNEQVEFDNGNPGSFGDPGEQSNGGPGNGNGSGNGMGAANMNSNPGSPTPRPTVAVRLTPVWPGGARDPASYASVTAFVGGRKKEDDKKTLGSATYLEYTVDCDQTIDVWVSGGYDTHGYHPYIPCDKTVVNVGNLLIGTRRYSLR
jgi:hypothetical protein